MMKKSKIILALIASGGLAATLLFQNCAGYSPAGASSSSEEGFVQNPSPEPVIIPSTQKYVYTNLSASGTFESFESLNGGFSEGDWAYRVNLDSGKIRDLNNGEEFDFCGEDDLEELVSLVSERNFKIVEEPTGKNLICTMALVIPYAAIAGESSDEAIELGGKGSNGCTGGVYFVERSMKREFDALIQRCADNM